MKKELLLNGITFAALTPGIGLGGKFEQDIQIQNQPAIPENQIVFETQLPSEELFTQNVKIQNGEKERNFLNHPNNQEKAFVTAGILAATLIFSAIASRTEPGSTKTELARLRLGQAFLYLAAAGGIYLLWK